MWLDGQPEGVTLGASQRFLSYKARRDESVKHMKRSRKVPGSLTTQSKLVFSRLEGFEVDPIFGGNHPCALCRRCQTEFPGSEVVRGCRSHSMGGEGQLQTGAALGAWHKTFHCGIKRAIEVL